MNFLAHALLAADCPAMRVGGLAGDFVKGVLPGRLPADLADGVALHRAIDGYADQHAAFRASRARVSLLRRRYAGVLVDMFYDHLLARDWPAYSDHDLETFARETYALAHQRLADLPAGFAPVLAAMSTHDWLSAYREAGAIGRALDRMALHRARRPNPLAGSVDELIAAYDDFGADFSAFFPDVRAFALRWSSERGVPQ